MLLHVRHFRWFFMIQSSGRDQSGQHAEVLCTSSENGSFCSSPLSSESLSESTLLPDMSHSQWFHQRPDKIQSGPSPSLSAVVKWAQDLFVQGEEASWAVMGHNSQPVPRNKWLSKYLIFLSFLVLLRFLTHMTAINHCHWRIYFL